MTPVTQTKVVIKNKAGEIVVNGNCYAAAVASLLDLPISEVPNCELFFDDKEEDMFYEMLMKRFLKNKGLELIKDWQFAVFHDPSRFSISLAEVEKLKAELTDRYYLATGKSARGFDHICVYQNGNLIHDPHPSRDGLETVYEWEIIQPISTPNPERSDATEAK